MLGTNLGDRLDNLERARNQLSSRVGSIKRVSSVYKTAPWELDNVPDFLNQAVILSTSHEPEKVMSLLLEIESDLGRIRDQQSGSRTIDLDLLLLGTCTYRSDILTLPHPRFHQRRFNMLPVNEIASEWLHPVLGLTMNQLLESCQDRLPVSVF